MRSGKMHLHCYPRPMVIGINMINCPMHLHFFQSVARMSVGSAPRASAGAGVQESFIVKFISKCSPKDEEQAQGIRRSHPDGSLIYTQTARVRLFGSSAVFIQQGT